MTSNDSSSMMSRIIASLTRSWKRLECVDLMLAMRKSIHRVKAFKAVKQKNLPHYDITPATGTCGRGGAIIPIQEIVDLWKCGVCYCSSSKSSFGCCDSRYCFMLSELTTFFPVCCSKASFATRPTEPPLSATLACSLIV